MKDKAYRLWQEDHRALGVFLNGNSPLSKEQSWFRKALIKLVGGHTNEQVRVWTWNGHMEVKGFLHRIFYS